MGDSVSPPSPEVVVEGRRMDWQGGENRQERTYGIKYSHIEPSISRTPTPPIKSVRLLPLPRGVQGRARRAV